MKIGLVLVLQLIAFSVFSQTRVLTKTYQDFQVLQHLRLAESSRKSDSLKIEGSPFLNNKFIKGEVLTEKNVRYVGIPLRYNVYNDRIEFKDSKGEVYSIQFPGNIEQVKIGHDIFVYHLFFVAADRVAYGYLQKIIEGKANGFIRHRVFYEEAQPALAYKDPQPPKFIPQLPYYYVSLDNKPAVRMISTKKLIKFLGNNTKQLETFARKNKIRVRKLNDFILILNYYNSLP